MRKIRDVLRLHTGDMAKRRIAISLNIGRTGVDDYIIPTAISIDRCVPTVSYRLT